MIEIICDRCERAFTVDDEAAGTKVPCPSCGDINRVPAAGAPAPAPAPAPAAAAPPGAGPEKTIRVVRPAMFRAHPLRFLTILALVVGGIAGAIALWDAERSWTIWGPLVFTLGGLGWLAKWWIAAHWWIKITITNKRTIRHEGIVRRHSTEVMHDHVRSVDINQNFLQRLFRVGYIGIDSAGQDGIEIEIRDIPGPYEIKKVIDRYRSM
jgi:hypothetical protein